jgi:hypothetical protein
MNPSFGSKSAQPATNGRWGKGNLLGNRVCSARIIALHNIEELEIKFVEHPCVSSSLENGQMLGGRSYADPSLNFLICSIGRDIVSVKRQSGAARR